MKSPEKILKNRLEAAFRKARVRIPVRTVHRWRGRRFVTALRVVVSKFQG